MKKFWKATLIPGVICILAGLVLSAILTFGFHEELLEHADEFSINEDNFFEYFDNDRFVSMTRSGTRYDKSETKESYHFTVEQGETITGINFEIAVGEVEIRTGDTMEVVVTDMFENAISSHVEDGVWYITDSLIGSGSVHSDYSPEITITMPENLDLNKCDIYLAAGLMNIDKLNADDLILEVDAGSLKIFSLAAKDSLMIKNGVGEVKIYDAAIRNLSVEAGIGAIDITGAVSGYNTVKGGIGEVKLTLTDRNRVDFNYKVTCGIGEVEIGDMRFSGNTENISYDRGEADYFELDCGIGHIEIDINGN